ncbi:autotransporter outer membrane beta-barrel domain-containing protein [Tardiphaga alba]|uniref:autotransporter outer membrane beta-barrel domain-containing protein n=1 Tax=Tardiphaga alba TaxID=340268 RepID=UPI001BAB5883|nr:autotransporter domain-containing protein [Tardiphaga alba]
MSGGGTVQLGAASLTTGGDNTNTDFSGQIDGTGGLTKVGSGRLTLSGANSYSGDTIASAGTLALQNNQALGSGTLRVGDALISFGANVTIANAINLTSAAVQFQVLSGSATLTGTISETTASPPFGPKPFEKIGAGTLILTGNNSYTGLTTVTAGALNIQNSTALGSTGAGTTVAAGAALQVEGSITIFTEALTLNGMGVANDGALRNIAGNNTYGGAITLQSASRINADAGSLTLNGGLANGGHDLTVGGAGNVTASSVISGAGGLIKTGAGILALEASNTYSGATTVNGGTLRAGATNALSGDSAMTVAAGTLDLNSFANAVGSLAGAGAVSLGSARLTAGSDNTSTSFAGAISGTGGLTKTGTGTLTLATANAYTGTTIVDAGTLSVNGSIASSSMTTVNTGGTLGGNGIVGNTTIDGGTLSPGNSIGLLTVQGNLSLTAASSYMVEVSPTNADRVDVIGTATLGNATVNARFAPGSYVARQYTILNATLGVSGTFGTQVNTDLPSNFSSNLSYDPNNAYLNLTLNFDPSFGGSLNRNQQAVANTLTGFFNRTGGIPLVFGGLNAAGLTQAAGELGTGSQQTAFDAMNLFMGVMSDPFTAGRDVAAGGAASYADDAMAYAGKRSRTDAFASMHRKAPSSAPAFQERWNVWVAGFGGSRGTDGSAVTGSSDTTSRIYGTAIGADHWFSPNTIAGFSLAGGGTSFSVNSGGAGRSDLFQAGAFVRHAVGSAYVTAAAAYGWQDVSTERVVAAAGFERLRAQFNANSYSGRIEAGSRVVASWLGGVGLAPYAAAQVTSFDLPSYAETGTGGATTFALAYRGKTVTATRSELGIRSDKSFALADAILTLRGRAAWAHDYNTDRSIAATFQALPGASFAVNGAAQARNAALTTASAEMTWMNGWSAATTFEGEFSDIARSYAGKGLVRYSW